MDDAAPAVVDDDDDAAAVRPGHLIAAPDSWQVLDDEIEAAVRLHTIAFLCRRIDRRCAVAQGSVTHGDASRDGITEQNP
jgi:hypothetical protein